MYDEFLRSNLPGCNTTNSSARLVAFADDVALLASRRTTEWLEISANSALTTVESWMEENGLHLSVTKTETVMLTTKRAYIKPKFYIKGIELGLKKEVKYLGVMLSERLGYRRHLEIAQNKATNAALSRLISNIDGPTQKKRNILITVAISQIIYSAPIWSSALECKDKLQSWRSQEKLI